ncbi:hypothetical protein H8356DRAFT_1363385 [Neocallimastix lanati (nom. inval.)]|nr:hypothetical protein H8356DRAFT_1363385 [Neocallimastix sp. JGI-2020a]
MNVIKIGLQHIRDIYRKVRNASPGTAKLLQYANNSSPYSKLITVWPYGRWVPICAIRIDIIKMKEYVIICKEDMENFSSKINKLMKISYSNKLKLIFIWDVNEENYLYKFNFNFLK